MTDSVEVPFLQFLRNGVAKGGFETDDVLAAILPLMKQVRAVHEAGLVAPLDGIQHLTIAEQGHLLFAPAKVSSPEKNSTKVDALQAPVSHAVEVVGELRRTADIDQGSIAISDLGLGTADAPITKPVYLPNYRSWEHAIGHHDELTDIFSVGMLLASVACGLDFTDRSDIEAFITHRNNLFAINRRLNPVVASVIVQMTALNRHQRAPELAEIISRLDNYREQETDLDFNSL